MKNISAQNIIIVSFYILFFLVQLLMTPWNYELFEYNKMMLTYALTVIIAASWAIKMVSAKKINIKRSALDIPLGLFLLSQIVATVFSIDRHVSLFGYYSRFNGGLLSTISYLLLFYAFVSNFPIEKIPKLLKFTLASAVLVSLYGILEHFGIDKNIWVQDVANRVFSTLGQPNWLAAYVAVLIPVGLAYYASRVRKNFVPLFVTLIFFTTLVFTKSRSGFIGLAFGLSVFWILTFLKNKKVILKPFLIINSLFLILIFIFGTPFSFFDKFTLLGFKNKNTTAAVTESAPAGSSVIDVGITESGEIRNIVWKGALDIVRHHPIIGTGVETFAFSYFKYRPVEHNMTSEWDFLYNKAHNEYLNYAATTGIFGLGSYLLFIGTFILLFFKSFSNKSLNNREPESPNLLFGLFSGWLTILITNFFGFSVVIIQLLFFLIPALILVLNTGNTQINNEVYHLNSPQYILKALILLIALFLIGRLTMYWIADFYFARGFSQVRSQEFGAGYENIKKAILLNGKEPLYHDELAVPAVQLGLYLAQQKDSTSSARLINEGISANQEALNTSPANINFWKTRTRILYALTSIDDKYLKDAILSLQIAADLSPTDPKIHYNLALIYDAADKHEEAYSELAKTIELKINYRDAYLARATFYARDKRPDKAQEDLNFILTRINPKDSEAQKQLEELK